MSQPISDEWQRKEYEELSEDLRHFNEMSWQATVATIAADGLIIGTLVSVKDLHPWFGFLPLIAAVLTFLIGLTTLKWVLRSGDRIQQLYSYGGLRFGYRETGVRAWHLGKTLVALMMAVGIGLVIYALILFIPQLWFLIQ
jgi:hypothetical protein